MSVSDAVQYRMNLAMWLVGRGDLDEAARLLREVIALQPELPEAHYNLGKILRIQGNLEQAIAAYRQALALRPNFLPALLNLANALKDAGKLDESVAAGRQAVTLAPNSAEGHFNLGCALQEQGEMDAAIEQYRWAITLRPDYVKAHNNLGVAIHGRGRLDQAIEAYRQALACKADDAEALCNLGTAFKDAGRVVEAIAFYRRSAEVRPDARVASNVLSTIHYSPDFTPQQIAEEHRRWEQTYAVPLMPVGHTFLSAGRQECLPHRLRIGYVSSDFREHPVGRFMLPLLAHHNRAAVEVYCYSDVRGADAMTARLQSFTEHWRMTAGMSDERLAAMLRKDKIDILVDLALHMEGNRLLVFARKPAPVQVTYLAYCSTSGLRTMDYRLSDPYLDAQGADESVYTEKTVRLPRTYWCYRPPEDSPEVTPPPVERSGLLTFGCLNNYCKASEPAFAAWRELLHRVPNSRLLLHALEGSHRQAARERLAATGIDPARLQFVGRRQMIEHLQCYHQIDIALDPFPFPGGTTTCDALWMGVPVVSLTGQTAASRAGLSILSNVGLGGLVATNVEEYLRIASGLANDLPWLAELRRTMRARMRASPLMDARQFALDVEAAYRTMWQASTVPQPGV